jgi:hypothetical protein
MEASICMGLTLTFKDVLGQIARERSHNEWGNLLFTI